MGGGVLVTRARRPRGATRALAAAAAALAVCAAALCALLAPAPSRAQEGAAAGADVPFALTKTATNLDGSYESEVTLGIEYPQPEYDQTYDIVFVIDRNVYISESFEDELREFMDSVGEGHANIGIVCGGRVSALSADQPPSMTTLLELTPLNGRNFDTIAQAFDDADSDSVEGINKNVTNLEAGVALATRMLDEAAQVSGSDGSNQCLVLLSGGFVNAWGTEAEGDPCQSFHFDPGESIDWDKLDEAYGASLSQLTKEGLTSWMGSVRTRIENDIKQYGNSDVSNVSPDGGPYVGIDDTLAGEAAVYRLASYYEGLADDGALSSNRLYLFGYGRGPHGQSNESEFVRSAILGLPTICHGDSKAFEGDRLVANTFDAIGGLVGSADPNMPDKESSMFVGDVIGFGSDDGHGNAYDFSFVPNQEMLSLQIDGQSYAAYEFAEENGIRAYFFENSEGEPVNCYLYYLPQGWGSADELAGVEDALAPILGDSSSDAESIVLMFGVDSSGELPFYEEAQLTYRVKLDDPQTTPGTYGTYDEDGSEGYEGLLTNESARLGVVSWTSDGDIVYDDIYEFPRPTVSYTVQPDPTKRVEVKPADITVYMGGDEGHGAVVGPDGSVSASGSLPEPGFYVTLPDEANAALEAAGVRVDGEAADLSDHIAVRTADGSRSWTLERYGDTHSGAYGRFVYRIVPAEGQEPIRLQFTDTDGNTYVSDEFDVASAAALNRDYAMTIYGGDVDLGNVWMDVTAGGETSTYVIDVKPAELSVRYVTGEQADVVTGVLDEGAEIPGDGRAHATVPEGTEFYVNDSQIDVTDAAAPSLLFDDVVSADNTEGAGEWRTALRDRAADALADAGVELDSPSYQERYLDLVDANNGNAWLRSSSPVTVYWPYPEGTDESTDFSLVHLRGLHRDMGTGDVEGAVASAEAEVVEVENTPYGIRFTTDGFSPFVLAWDAGSGGGAGSTPQPGPGAAIPATGDPSWLLAPLATCSAGALALAASRRRG